MELYEITAPTLNSSEYGANIAEVFNNINENFKILANSNYTRGASGLTVSLDEVSLNTYIDDIANVIYSYASEELGSTSTTDDIKTQLSAQGGNLYMFKTYSSDTDEYEYVTSLPYWYIDTDRTSSDETYVDKSCAIVYKNEEWQVIPVFPTFYVDSTDNTICWKLNGEETGISIN